MFEVSLFETGLKAGGALWLLSGASLFIPLWLRIAYPYWGKKNGLKEFTVRSILVLMAATLPGGTIIGGALLIQSATSDEFDDEEEVPVKDSPSNGATFPTGCQ